jgi:diaminopimelate epimerase
MLKFTKMHGCGNDYVYIDGHVEKIAAPARLAPLISDRHFGAGSDGLVLILPSRKADARMRMFNADGTEAEMCGNAIRCVARYVYERRHVRRAVMTIETKAGVKTIRLTTKGGRVDAITVDMGAPVLTPADIPVAAASNRIRIGARAFVCVSMGNPHAVTFVPDVTRAPVREQGPALERHALFPRRCNIEFCQVITRDRLRMRVWERGAGETLACGTGACAAVVAAALEGKTGRRVRVGLLGGELAIEWSARDNHVYMTGPAEFVYDGVWLK